MNTLSSLFFYVLSGLINTLIRALNATTVNRLFNLILKNPWFPRPAF